jgi:hypothetical protein
VNFLANMDRFGELLAMRDHLLLFIEVMDIDFTGRQGFNQECLRNWSNARAVNACRLLNVEDEMQAILDRAWPPGFPENTHG